MGGNQYSIPQSHPKVEFSELKMHPLLRPTTKKEKRYGAYIRTASTDFVDKLKNLKCQRRNTPNDKCGELLSHENLPVIAYCGHYVGETCCVSKIDEVFPHENISCCPISNENEEMRKICFTDKTLNGFLKAVTEKGYKCVGCNKLHPQNNSVRVCVNDRDAFLILCVWCAATKEKYIDCVVTNIEKGDESENKGSEDDSKTNETEDNSTKNAEDDSKKKELDSVDYSEQINVGCAYAQCCTCKKDLDNVNDLNPPPPMNHLPCGHICHEKCFIDNKEIICNICGTKNNKNKDSLVIPYKYERWENGFTFIPCALKLSGLNLHENECPECERLHPYENVITNLITLKSICVWCSVVKNQERVTKDNDKKAKNKNKHVKETEKNLSNNLTT